MLALAGGGCSTNGLIDYAMAGAAHPPPHAGLVVGDRRVLAGDLHCHVLPPDSPYHVSRELDETVALAEREGLDFVVLTPHVRPRFYADAEERAWTEVAIRDLVTRARAKRTSVMLVPGFEYTDWSWGHVGAGFADLDAVLAEVPLADAAAHPELFFERWVAHGGFLTINHPLLRPLAVAPVSELRADLSWRGFRADAPPEIAWIGRHAQAIETENLEVAELRDRLFLGDEDRSLRAVTHLLSDQIHAQQRRIAAVAGSDSHGHWLRADTFVLARERTVPALHQALLEGRTCVKAPGACTLELRSVGDSAWHGVGEAIDGVDAIELRARGDDIQFFVGGDAPHTGSPTRIAVPRDRCTLVRAVVDGGWSSPIYVNCAFAR